MSLTCNCLEMEYLFLDIKWYIVLIDKFASPNLSGLHFCFNSENANPNARVVSTSKLSESICLKFLNF